MKKREIKLLLTVIIFGLSFLALMINSISVSNADAETVRDQDVYVTNDSTILFNYESEMEHFIHVEGSGIVTFTMIFDHYHYFADMGSGCMEVILHSPSISQLNINIIVNGVCDLSGGNHPGLRVPDDTNVLLSFYMQEGSSMSFSSQDGSRALRNSSDRADNIDYAFYNTEDSQSIYEIMKYQERDSYAFLYEDNGDPYSPSGSGGEIDPSGNNNQEPVVVTSVGVDVTDGSTIMFNYNSEMRHDIYVEGSGLVTFTMIFDHYQYTAGEWEMCMEILLLGRSITQLNINIIVYGICELTGYNQAGLTVPADVDVLLTFYMQEDSIISFRTQDGRRAIRNSSDTADNIGYDFFNTKDSQTAFESLKYTDRDNYSIYYEYHGDPYTPFDSTHNHVASEWEIVYPASCEDFGLRRQICLECGDIIVEEEIIPTGHNWGEATYEWIDNDSFVRAYCVCLNDPSHVEEELGSVMVSYIDPTCETEGQIVYTAFFENPNFERQTKTETIEPLGHDYYHESHPATYDEPGWEKDTCSRCGDIIFEELPILERPDDVVTNAELASTNPEVQDGSSILFNDQNLEEHQIYVSGSGTVTFTIVFDNYQYVAGRWSGCMSIKLRGQSITKLNVNIIVIGSCELAGGNHPGLRVPADIDVLLTFYMQPNSDILFRSQDRSRALRNNNENDNEENINYVFFNTENSEEVYNTLKNESRDNYSLRYEDKGESYSPGDNGDHDHEGGEWYIERLASCDEPGLRKQTCLVCGCVMAEEEIPATGHNWDEASYVWDFEHMTLTASRTCLNNHEHMEIETVAIMQEITEATCLEEGFIYYYSNPFNNPGFSEQTKTVTLEPLGHNWGEVSYDWDFEHMTLTASRICLNDHNHTHDHIETVEIYGEVIKEPSCDESGEMVYHSGEFSLFEDFNPQMTNRSIEPLGHNWDETSYDWDFEHMTLTASRTCLNNPEHMEIETVAIMQEITEATCLEEGFIYYYSNPFNNPGFSEQTKTVTLEPLGHDYYHESKAATFDEPGWEKDTCMHCGEIIFEERPILERPAEDDPDAEEEFKEMVAQNITDIVGDEIETEALAENIANTPVEVLADIVEVVGIAYNTINEMFSEVEDGEKIEIQPGVELTKEEAYEIVQQVTASTIIIAGSQEANVEAANEIDNMLPADSGINIGDVVSDFYERVLSELLSGPQSTTRHDTVSYILFGDEPINKNNNLNSPQGIDYSVSAETYQRAIDFVELSVSNMTNAALRIRECSGESLKTSINHYISGVSVQSFRDFDRAKADAEFAEAAYQAILISLQETVKNTLTENYEKAKANKSGRALKDLEEAYNKEMEQVSHLHFLENISDDECEGCFEDVVIEIMRLKYLSILNNKLDQKEITTEIFNEYANLASDVETFAPVYKDIFYSWAIGAENDMEVKITLQELSDAAIENTSNKINPPVADVKVLPLEWIIIGGVSTVLIALVVVYIFISKKKEV